MALTHLALLVLILNVINICEGRPSSSVVSKTAYDSESLDSKRKSLVEDAFLEQKDVLLDMLESKLKEVRDKKKKKDKPDKSSDRLNCDFIKDIELKIKSSGLIAVGESDITIKYGKSGNTKLSLDASGISNVGKARLDLGIDDGTLYLPGLSNLFSSFEKICRNVTNVTKENIEREGPPQKEEKDKSEEQIVSNVTNDNIKREGQPIEEHDQPEELEFDSRRSGSNNNTSENKTKNKVIANENTEITIPVQVIMDETTKNFDSNTNNAPVDNKTSDNSSKLASGPAVISENPTTVSNT